MRAGLVAWLFIAIVAACPIARAEVRLALVIGNGTYPHSVGPLKNPVADARLMATTLQRLGFQVESRLDVDQKAMKAAIVDFGARLEAAGSDAVGLFYFAGHGVAAGGENYLLPLDAELTSERQLPVEAVPASMVLTQMQFAGNRLNFLVLDACRNNALSRSTRSQVRGLTRMEAPRGTLIVYATEPGAVALDGNGVNSPFTQALSDSMMLPGLDAQLVVREARNKVIAATNGRQVPWEEGGITQAFYFLAPVTVVAPPAPLPPPAEPSLVAWQGIADSTRPADFAAFIAAFPASPLVPIARQRLRDLSPAEPGTVPPQPAAPPPVPAPLTMPAPVPAVPVAPPVGTDWSGTWRAAQGALSIELTIAAGRVEMVVDCRGKSGRNTATMRDGAFSANVRLRFGDGLTNVFVKGDMPRVTLSLIGGSACADGDFVLAAAP